MPIVDANDPTVWEAQYRSPWWVYGGPSVGWTVGGHFGLTRGAFFDARRPHAEKLIAALNLAPGQTVVVIGGTYGWTCEWLVQLVPGLAAVNAEISSHIQATKGRSSRAYMLGKGCPQDQVDARAPSDTPEAVLEVLDVDVTKGAGRADIRKLNPTWLVSENVLPWVNDSEATSLDNAMRQVAPSAHLVTPLLPNTPPEPLPAWNWKSIADWKSLLPGSIIISTYDDTVM